MDSLSTNPRRATLAVTAGAVIGALGVAIVVLLLATIATGVVSAADLIVAILIFLVALVGWSLGLFLFGLPLWWLFHRNGWRGRRVADAARRGDDLCHRLSARDLRWHFRRRHRQ